MLAFHISPWSLNPSRTRVWPVRPPYAHRGLTCACCRCGPSDVADQEDVADRADVADREDIADRVDVADREDVADWEDVADQADVADWEDVADLACACCRCGPT
jgi:hypothetical protein